MIQIDHLELENDKRLDNLMTLRWDIFVNRLEAQRLNKKEETERWNRLFKYINWHVELRMSAAVGSATSPHPTRLSLSKNEKGTKDGVNPFVPLCLCAFVFIELLNVCG